MGDINRVEYLGGFLGVIIAFISICCSLMTLYLIRKIGRWNGYIALVWSMTVSQIVYDVTFGLVFPNDIIFYSNIFVSTFGGTSVTLWTNVMSSVVAYMVSGRTPIDTLAYYWYFFAFCVILPLLYAIASDILIGMGYLDQLDFSYNIIRLASIVFNFVLYFFVWRVLSGYSKRGVLPIDHPLVVLSSRLKYYPIVQIITRIWPSVYEFKYGNSLAHANYNTTTMSSDIEFVFYAAFLPSAGIGYFLVFLKVQPMAYHFFSLLFKRKKRAGSQEIFKESLTSLDPYLTNNDSFGSNVSGAQSAAHSVLTPFCARSDMDEEQLLCELQKERGIKSHSSVDNPTIQL